MIHDCATASMSRPQHSRALDGLRWFSFLGVFLYHSDDSVFRFGKYGVQIFFVLSGFLIGNILLTLRQQTALPITERLKIFYLRRSLRIFPLYYFVLCMIAVLGSLHLINGHLNVLPYHALYLSNLYLAFTGARLDAQTHLWSLCVEEHFYLLAPLVLLLVGYRSLAAGFLCVFILIACARSANFLFWQNPRFDYLSPIQFDILLAGIIAAVLLSRKQSFMGLTEERLKKLGSCCGMACLAIFFWMYFPTPTEIFVESVVFPPLLAVATSALLLTVWKGGLPILRQVCSWPPFVYLGQISYGLYVYHSLIFFVFTRYSTGLERALRLLACLLATIAIATLSWYLLEKPFLQLKRRYPYRAANARIAAAPFNVCVEPPDCVQDRSQA